MSNTEFPTILYKCPGEHHCPGGTYGYIQAVSQEDMDEKLKSGYQDTLPKAILYSLGKLPPDKESNLEDDSETNNAPTREEMEIKALELGVEFRSNLSDEKLLSRINDKIDELGE